MVPDDEWVVVGGSGKAKKGSKKGTSNSHGAQPPVHSQTPGAAIPPAVPAAVAPLPGWEAGSAVGCAQPSAQAKPRRGRHRILERTTEELAADLKQQVQQCRLDIESSSIFASLQQAFLAGAPHLPFLAHKPQSQSPPTPSVDTSQQTPSLHHPHQLPQQHQQEHRQEHSGKEERSEQQPPLQQQHFCLQEPQLQQQQQQQQEVQGQPERCAGNRQGLLAPQPGWQQVQELVIFGLGSMQTSSTSRYQLAMASLLATKLLPGLQAPPMAFDPAFTPADVALLHSMGIAVISNNQLCAHRAHVPTFFYLPHLEGRLCDNLLAANSSSSSSIDSTAHHSAAHTRERSSSEGGPPQNVVCTPAGSSSVPCAQEVCSQGTQAPNSISSSTVGTASSGSNGARPAPGTAEGSSDFPGSTQGPCANRHQQHTLHNCVLLANRFSTYEGRAPGPGAAVGGEGGRSHRSKQGGKGRKGGKLGGDAEGVQQGNGAANASQGGVGGLEAVLASGQPATMVSLVSTGAVLELQIKEDKRFPSPSAFNDMALHIIP